jgi:putative endonuclease
MTATRRSLGLAGEAAAARHLASRGFTVLERNARTRHGEIDLIALDGSTLAFVEVKTLRQGGRRGPERPVLAVGPRKRARLRSLAGAWLAQRRVPSGVRELRFDAVGVVFDGAGNLVELEHIRAAF